MVLVVKNLPANAGDIRDAGLTPESGKSPGQRTLVGYGPQGHKESGTTEAT